MTGIPSQAVDTAEILAERKININARYYQPVIGNWTLLTPNSTDWIQIIAYKQQKLKFRRYSKHLGKIPNSG